MRTTRHILYFLASAILFAWALFLPAGCGGDGNAAPKIIKKDTAITLAVFMGYKLQSVHYGRARRITHDSLTLTWNGDTTEAKRKWSKVTWYEAEVPIQVDSQWHKAFGDPMLDSTGKPNVIIRLLQLPPQYVRDTIFDLDSAFRYLEKFRVKDSTIKK